MRRIDVPSVSTTWAWWSSRLTVAVASVFGLMGSDSERWRLEVTATGHRRFDSQLGTTENPPGSNRTAYCEWYGLTGPWCAMFVSWCFFIEGLLLAASTSKGFAYTPAGAQWFKKKGRWTQTPERGHMVFFDFPNDSVKRISHVGIVTGVNADGSIDTIEGNTDERGGRTGGKVMRRRRAVGNVGYGISCSGRRRALARGNQCRPAPRAPRRVPRRGTIPTAR